MDIKAVSLWIRTVLDRQVALFLKEMQMSSQIFSTTFVILGQTSSSYSNRTPSRKDGDDGVCGVFYKRPANCYWLIWP